MASLPQRPRRRRRWGGSPESENPRSRVRIPGAASCCSGARLWASVARH